jgi:hypothetical protein
MRDIQDGSIIVRLPGLQVSSFCVPSLISRQYGYPQQIVKDLRDRLLTDAAPLTMADRRIQTLFDRIYLEGFFPSRPLLKQSRGITHLTTEYLQWYGNQRGPVQKAIEDRRVEYTGYSDSLELRRKEARDDPDDVTGDAVTDYANQLERRARLREDPEVMLRRARLRQEREEQGKLKACGLIAPPVHKIPELGRGQTDLFDLPKPKTSRGPRKRKRNANSGVGTSD